ncbi:MAG TPA: hypothetical protein VNQ90_06865, partial [Chthoniobacteraceae bacterium]|nr:hypothetical protein [Chthoniobacteraceae bacterium]
MIPFQPTADDLLLVCREENDLYQTLKANGVPCRRLQEPEEAFATAPPRGALLLLADDYPEQPLEIRERWLELAKTKQLRLYLEFPASLPGVPSTSARKAGRLERGVISCDRFGPPFPAGTIVTVPGAHPIEAMASDPWLVLGVVAGFSRISFELAGAETRPLLFTLPESETMVATIGLSHFLRGRFAPAAAWQAIFSNLVHWLTRGRRQIQLEWQPRAAPAFGREETLPSEAGEEALSRAASWFYRARLFLPPGKEAAYRAARGDSRPLMAHWPEGNGSHGVLEGLTSAIDHRGKQGVRWWRRADCTGEVSGAMALAGLARGDGRWKETASRLGDWLYSGSILSQGERALPSSPCYGLLGWHDRAAYGIYTDGWEVYYGDDNARAVLGTIAAAGALG